MKILVLGAGVVGATAAYVLAREGHAVTVIDRQPAPGLETSKANGGQVSASHATPWATPETPLKALKWLGRDDAPLLFRWFRYDPALWAWGLRFLRNCTQGRADANTERTVRIALYSRERLKALRAETGIAYDSLSRGILHIFRDRREFEAQCHAAAVMTGAGLPQTVLTPQEAVNLEPALSRAAETLVGAIHSPDDESGDAHAFTQEIARLAQAHGAVFLHGESVLAVERDGDRLGAVLTDRARHSADAAVLSLGSWSPLLVRSLGLRLPIYPAKGYSITLPVSGPAPMVSITDDEYKMVFSRLGQRLRAAGTAELAGWDTALRPRRVQLITDNCRRVFPLAGDYALAEPWCGLRPKTPDSLPYVCPTPIRGLFLNTGHGTLGWTMAVGSAYLLADLLAGRAPDIDPAGYGLRR